jgi:hypothetical protein
MKLQKKLEAFATSDMRFDIITSSIGEIRDIFKPKEEKAPLVQKFKYYILNSIWNRTPNFIIQAVLMDKLRYAIKLGIGISSYNQLPISWIEDPIFKSKNFLMKDRGHITTLICWLYGELFALSAFEIIVDELLKEYKQIDGWADDYSLSNSVGILTDIKIFISESKKLKSKAGIKKSDQKLSIENVCENIPKFGKTLNERPISIEVTKESILAHMMEILGINNTVNTWMIYQTAYLWFVGQVMRIDGSDNFFREIFNVPAVATHIDTLETFNGNSDVILLSSDVKKYKKKLKEYSEVIPIRFLALRKYNTFENRAKTYYVRNQFEIRPQLMALYNWKSAPLDSKQPSYPFSEEMAKVELTLMNNIAKLPKWKEYQTKRKLLLAIQPDKANSSNLKAADLTKEDFGIACIDAVIELIDLIPGTGTRTSKNQISIVVTDFVDGLITQLEDAVENDTLASAPIGMEHRFTKLIIPTYRKLKDSYKNDSFTHDKNSIYKALRDELLLKMPNQTKFKVIKFTNESYREIETTYVDFGAETRATSGFDLGERIQTMGYGLDNCILQEKHHNRSAHGGNHNVTNIGYWEVYSKKNSELVNKHKQMFLDSEEYDVISDAKKFNEVFNG